jgi:manganese/zinc/iron transport system permease protein
VVGLQAVGLILVVALLIIPAAAARFWTDGLLKMTLLSGLFGALSGYLGSTISALFARLPTGPVIVVCAGVLFFISMFFAPRRGVIASLIRKHRLRRRIAFQNLLRDLTELEEAVGRGARVPLPALLAKRRWVGVDLRRALAQAVDQGMATSDEKQQVRLTRSGRAEGLRVLRNHRLWEMYLISHADIAPSHVDRDADLIEHLLPPDLVRELEEALEQQARIPPSPHVKGALP